MSFYLILALALLAIVVPIAAWLLQPERALPCHRCGAPSYFLWDGEPICVDCADAQLTRRPPRAS